MASNSKEFRRISKILNSADTIEIQDIQFSLQMPAILLDFIFKYHKLEPEEMVVLHHNLGILMYKALKDAAPGPQIWSMDDE